MQSAEQLPMKRPQPIGGSRRGKPNKATRTLKEMILRAVDAADPEGAVAYLTRCANNPKTAPAFLNLLGKVLPLQVQSAAGDGVRFIVQCIEVNGGPVPGVLNSPVQQHVATARIAAPRGEVIDA